MSNVRTLSRIIAQDPGITARLFKATKNSVFRKFQPFSSLEHVLQAVGLQQTGNLVRAIAFSSELPAKHNQKAFDAFWARSQAISELAILIAEDRVTVCNIFPDQACLAEEDLRFNADHCVIGYSIGRHWQLPDFICDAIRFPHDMNRIENHAARSMVAILQLAIEIYHQVQRISNPEWEAVRKEVLEELGLGEDALPELVGVILECYQASP